MQLYEYTASQLGRMLREKQCSATELAKSALERMAATEPQVQAFITQTPEVALQAAAQVDKALAAGESLHPLAGIPIGIKDNICTKGVRTTCASKILHNFVPPYNATVMQKLAQTGCAMVGKTNMDEFAMGSSCETSYFQKTYNPHNPAYVPGGSSGGSAAAVAAGSCVVSLGSDTGGSIRQPASCCGIVGLKPTYGAVSRYGLVAFASSLDQIGPFGRSVEDVAMLFSAICGQDKFDATSAPHSWQEFSTPLIGDVKGLRIGIPKEYYGEGVECAVCDSVRDAIKQLEARGASLVELSLPSTPYALAAYYIISSAEASSNLARFDGVKYGYCAEGAESLTELYERTRSEGFGEEVKRRIMLGTFVLSSGYYDAYYKRAKLLQKRIQQEYAQAFEACDVIITPTTPTTAFAIGAHTEQPLKMYAADLCTVTVNIAGLPALSVPCGMVDGMPAGLQMIGPRFSEKVLLSTALCYEQLVGGFGGPVHCKTAAGEGK